MIVIQCFETVGWQK